VEVTVKPRAQAFLLADSVYQDRESGKYIIVGTFARLFVPSVPGHLGRTVAAYCALLGIQGTVSVTMQFETGAGEAIICSSPLTLTCDNPDLLVEFCFPIPSLPLESTGLFRLALIVDGVRVATYELDVHLTEKALAPRPAAPAAATPSAP
jgi:hypothetical protein